MVVRVLKRTTQLTGNETGPEILTAPAKLPYPRREPVKCYAPRHGCRCCVEETNR